MKRQVSRATRKELIEAVCTRTEQGASGRRSMIVDEFFTLTGYQNNQSDQVARQAS